MTRARQSLRVLRVRKALKADPSFLFSLTIQKKGKNTRQHFHLSRVRKELKGDSSWRNEWYKGWKLVQAMVELLKTCNGQEVG